MNLDLARELKKPRNIKVMVMPIVIDALGTIHTDLQRGQEKLEIRGRIEIGQITEKSPKDQKRFAFI